MVLVFCNRCGVYMEKVKLGVECPASNDVGDKRVRRGDLYRCPLCLVEVISDFGEPYEVR